MRACVSAVNRVRVRTAEREALAVRMAVARQVETTELSPAGLPPSAVLLIRSIRDPLPRRLSPHVRAGLPDRVWQQTLKDRVANAASSAVRPVRGRVDPAAAAVVFADEVELLACAAVHFATGGGALPWWLQAVERYAGGADLLSLLRAHPDVLPAVVEHVTQSGLLPDVLARLTSQEAVELARTALAVLEIPHLAALVASAAGPTGWPLGAARSRDDGRAEPIAEPGSAHSSAARAAVASSRAPTPARAPWSRVAPAAASFPTIEHEIFVGICLTARAAPGVLRSRGFRDDAFRWLEHRRMGEGSTIGPGAAVSAGTVVAGAGATPNSPAARGAVEREIEAGRARARSAPAVIPNGDPGPRADVEESPDGTRSALPIDPLSSALLPFSEGTATQLGGLLYLINVLEYFDLPDAFEESCGLASSVGAIGTLEAVARALAGDLPADARADPIWELLARLDSRRVGSPPRAADLDCSGLLLPRTWNVAARSPRRRLDREWEAFEYLRGEHWSEELIEWLALTMPCIRSRIARAMGISRRRRVDWVEQLFGLPARIHVADVHIDMVAPLDGVRLAVRVAGLDRSPGWVKSMQRVVLFHFE